MPDANEDRRQMARRLLGLLDLTRLADETDPRPIRAMCARAATPWGHPAAVCVYPRFLDAARDTLADHGLAGRVRLATVANFPEGTSDPAVAAAECRRAVELGADEIDVVLPWRALIEGNERACTRLVERCRAAAADRVLKVILETGMLGEPEEIRRAADIAIAGGADFIKTATGKAPTGATPEAAGTMLEAIAANGSDTGLKVSGGIGTLDQAAEYLRLAERIMGPEQVGPDRFRIGASGLLDELTGALGPETPG